MLLSLVILVRHHRLENIYKQSSPPKSSQKVMILLLLLLSSTLVTSHQHWGSYLGRGEVTYANHKLLDLDQLDVVCKIASTAHSTAKFEQFTDATVRPRLYTFLLHMCHDERRTIKQRQRKRMYLNHHR